MAEFVVVTGMSGAGRSTAAAALEDLRWFVIDNLPPALITKVAELVAVPGSETERVALVIGRGGGEQFDGVLPMLDSLRASRNRVRVLFLDAPDEVLIRRYEGTRRRHPREARGVEESVADERLLLDDLRQSADILIDTGDLNSNQLRQRIIELFGTEDGTGTGQMQVQVVSFGYKYGLPLDVDLVFDCRFLPNPYWVEELRDLSGESEPIRRFVLDQPETGAFLDRLEDLLTVLVPAFVREGKSYLSIAMGCTGGRHRSVVLAGELAERLSAHGIASSVFHRDVER
jgi:UPF0042 nucleotide-binding protein